MREVCLYIYVRVSGCLREKKRLIFVHLFEFIFFNPQPKTPQIPLIPKKINLFKLIYKSSRQK